MTVSNQPTANRPADYFPAMLRIAVDLACDVQQADPANPTGLTAKCPFHPRDQANTERTMTIDAKTALFNCTKCGARGNPYAFAAKAWRVTANDAHLLLRTNGQRVTGSRPPYPTSLNGASAARPRHMPEISNSALMTRALDHYRRNLLTSYPALRFMAKLAVDPQAAAAAGIGYSSGEGLIDHLTQTGITAQEMQDSPLLKNPALDETLAGRIILGDLDFTQGCIWLTSLATDEAMGNAPWRRGRPPTFGIPAMKPDLLNLYSVTPRSKTGYITDDARLYIILAADQLPVTLVTQKRRADTDMHDRAQRYARTFLRRQPKRAILVMHDHHLVTLLAEALAAQRPGIRVSTAGPPEIMEQLDPVTRNLETLSQLPPIKKQGQVQPGPATPPQGNKENEPESESYPGPDPLPATAGEKAPPTATASSSETE